MKLKDSVTYWTDPEKFRETSFLIGEIPEDAMVVVDSHSSSPIFADDHVNLIFACVKSGIITPYGALQLLPLPQKDLLMREYVEKEEAQKKFVENLQKTDPEAFEKYISKGGKK